MYQLVFRAFKNINKWIAIDSHHNFFQEMPIPIFVKSYVATRSSCYLFSNLSFKCVLNVFVHQRNAQFYIALHAFVVFAKTGEARRDSLPAAAR